MSETVTVTERWVTLPPEFPFACDCGKPARIGHTQRAGGIDLNTEAFCERCSPIVIFQRPTISNLLPEEFQDWKFYEVSHLKTLAEWEAMGQWALPAGEVKP